MGRKMTDQFRETSHDKITKLQKLGLSLATRIDDMELKINDMERRLKNLSREDGAGK
jgi:hypothetical protein